MKQNEAVEKGKMDDKAKGFQDFLETTTLHGIKYINDRNTLRRVIWLICILAAFIFCLVQSFFSFKSFYERTYTTAIVLKEEAQQQFPKVTFCNSNVMNTKSYQEFVIKNYPRTTDDEIKADLDYMGRSLRRLAERGYGVDYSRFLPLDNTTKFNKTRMDHFYKIYTSTNRSHVISDILMPKELFSCMYQTRACSIDDFAGFHSSFIGECYTFRPKSVDVHVTGREGGLKLLLDVGYNSYIKNGYTLNVGLSVDVHAQDAFPLMSEGIIVGPGVYTSLEVRRMELQSLPDPYPTNCGIDSNWDKKKSSYRRSLCKYNCYMRSLKEKCKCTVEYEDSNGTSPCLSQEQVKCNSEHSASLLSNNGYLKCQEECPESCKYTEYASKVSTAGLNVNNLVHDLNELCKSPLRQNESICQAIGSKPDREKHQYIRENVVCLEVFLKDNMYEEIKQVPSYELYSLISDMGGTLGLFLGMSVLTVTEIADFLFVAIWKKIKGSKTA